MTSEIDFSRLTQLNPDDESDRIKGLRDDLNKIYVGNQPGRDLAQGIIERVVSRFHPRNQVRGVYVLAGKRSTGRKTLVNSITKVCFGASDRRIMIDSSQLVNPYMVLRLVDASILNDGPSMPGMPGMRKRAVPLLSKENLEKVRGDSKVDCTIVCLDHFDAASEHLIAMLKRIYVDGVYGLEDAEAKKTDFRNVLWILLMDTDQLPGNADISADQEEVDLAGVEAFLENLGIKEYVSGIAICQHYSREEQDSILALEIDAFVEAVKNQSGCTLCVASCARGFLLDKIAEGDGSASDVTRNLEKYLIGPVNKLDLNGNVKKGTTIHVSCPGGDRLAFHAEDSAGEPAVSEEASEAAASPPQGVATTLDTGDAAAERERRKYSISHSFGSQADAEAGRDRVVSLLERLPETDRAEQVVKSPVKGLGTQFMMRVEFVTSHQGFEAVMKELSDWGPVNGVMYPKK